MKIRFSPFPCPSIVSTITKSGSNSTDLTAPNLHSPNLFQRHMIKILSSSSPTGNYKALLAIQDRFKITFFSFLCVVSPMLPSTFPREITKNKVNPTSQTSRFQNSKQQISLRGIWPKLPAAPNLWAITMFITLLRDVGPHMLIMLCFCCNSGYLTKHISRLSLCHVTMLPSISQHKSLQQAWPNSTILTGTKTPLTKPLPRGIWSACPPPYLS